MRCGRVVAVLIALAIPPRLEARPGGRARPALKASDVPGLVAKLESPDVQDKASVIAALSDVEPFEATRPALPALAKLAAAAPDALVLERALSALGRHGADPVALKALEAALRDRRVEVARVAAAALPAEPAAMALREFALRHSSVEVRRAAAGGLQRFRAPTPEVFAAIVRALEDPDDYVRSAAAQAAEAVGKGRSALGAPLMKALRAETDALARAFLVGALAVTGGVTAGDVALLGELAATGPDTLTRRCAADAIGRAGAIGAAAVPALRAVVERDPEPLVRAAAATALGAVGPLAAAALPALRAMALDRKGAHRDAAVAALGAIDTQGRAEVTEALIATLAETNEQVQAAALKVVQRRGAPGPALRTALVGLPIAERSANATLYLETLRALGLPTPTLAPADEVAALRIALEDEDASVREQALRRMSAFAEARRTPKRQAIDPSWLPGLIRAVDDPQSSNRGLATALLGAAGPAAKSAVGALTQRLLASEDGSRDLITALVRIAPSDPAVLEALARVLENAKPWRGDDAANALAALGRPGVPYLIRGVRSSMPEACFVAASALATVGPAAKAAVPALLELLADPSRLTVRRSGSFGTTRRQVVRALQAIAPTDRKVKAALASAGNLD